ncbi:hypothetical protein VKT23_018679 [Stygiomarasmius scandens]|uniref:Uncharacterized protein n=1 Tax=Marasmiellus scandens TaxID=2682957 RepID=A0ABR1IRE0_9AGAR
MAILEDSVIKGVSWLDLESTEAFEESLVNSPVPTEFKIFTELWADERKGLGTKDGRPAGKGSSSELPLVDVPLYSPTSPKTTIPGKSVRRSFQLASLHSSTKSKHRTSFISIATSASIFSVKSTQSSPVLETRVTIIPPTPKDPLYPLSITLPSGEDTSGAFPSPFTQNAAPFSTISSDAELQPSPPSKPRPTYPERQTTSETISTSSDVVDIVPPTSSSEGETRATSTVPSSAPRDIVSSLPSLSSSKMAAGIYENSPTLKRLSFASVATSASAYSQASAPSSEDFICVPPVPVPPLPNISSPPKLIVKPKPRRDSLQPPKVQSRRSSANYIMAGDGITDVEEVPRRLSFISVATSLSMYSQPSALPSPISTKRSSLVTIPNFPAPPTHLPTLQTLSIPNQRPASTFVLGPVPKPRRKPKTNITRRPTTIAVSTPRYHAAMFPPSTKRIQFAPSEEVQVLASAPRSASSTGRRASMILYHITLETPTPRSTLYDRSPVTLASATTPRPLPGYPHKRKVLDVIVHNADSRYPAGSGNTITPNRRHSACNTPVLTPYAYDPEEEGDGYDEDDWLHDPDVPPPEVEAVAVAKQRYQGDLSRDEKGQRSIVRSRDLYDDHWFSWSWLLDVVVMLFVVAGVLCLFILYPLLTHLERRARGV